MTKTMAEICLQQGYLQEAYEILTYLAEKTLRIWRSRRGWEN
jgi:hypothetical protein